MNRGICWITGGGSGIGRALARRLSAAGHLVVISGRRNEALLDTASGDTHIISWPLDITDAAAVHEAHAAITSAHGPIDLAILNAAQYRPMDLADFSARDLGALFNANVLGVANCLEPLFASMRARRQGRIAVIASVAGYRGLPKAAAYGASKAALINMLESLRPSAEAAGISLQVINPGFVSTPMTAENDFPMPFMISPEEAAERIIRGLKTDAFEIAFPRRFAFLLKIGRLLPYRLYFAITRRMIGA